MTSEPVDDKDNLAEIVKLRAAAAIISIIANLVEEHGVEIIHTAIDAIINKVNVDDETGSSLP